MRESTPEEMNSVKWSTEAVTLLQSFTEEQMITMFSHAQELADHANRVGIVPRDIELTNKFT